MGKTVISLMPEEPISMSIHPLQLAQSYTTMAPAATVSSFLPSVAAAVVTTTRPCSIRIRCGPRDNRGPLVKGRTLSTEAIHAIQALKRSPDSTASLSRLIKSDLVAALKELLRQDRIPLALRVLSVLESEHGRVDLSVYADVAATLARNGMLEEMDELVGILEREPGRMEGRERAGVWSRVLKAVIAASKRETVVRMCSVMRKEWGSGRADEYSVRVLCRGLRAVGETALADEVDRDYGRTRVWP